MCYDPIVVKNSNDIPVPCGKCQECKSRRVSAWSFRLRQEDKRSISTYFITLTYDNKNAASLLSRNGFLTLEPKHLELYFKRLRKAHEAYPCEFPIRFYAVGEYGGKSLRPHFHILLFNAKLELIDPAWNLGRVHFGNLTPASIGYCLKYISKPSKIPMHRNDDRVKEFSRMSKGLGENYVTEKMIAWHKADLENRMYLNIDNGKKVSMPRYYKDRIYNDQERETVAESSCLRASKKNSERAARAVAAGRSVSTGREISINAQKKVDHSPKKSKV